MSDRYEIREEIGKGGLGAVYKAFDNQLHREVAMKRVLTTEQGSEEEVQAAANNLIAEAQTLSSLNHPNIVTVFDIGRDDKGGFVVMELLKGETLDETVERGVLTQDDFIQVVHQTMEALIAAQASNVLHRDLKPTNVMVIWQPSGKFQTKILDFGLAKFSRTPSVQTMDQEDAVMGSIFFMAPEQFERAELDVRSDLYQIGCVYYHALTGQYPFRGETGPQVMNAHLQHRVTPLDKLRPDLSPSVCQWVMWLINRDKENRPAHAQEALDRFPTNPEPPGQAVLQAIPVEESDESATTGVHVVVPEHSAKPPPKLIVTGSSPVHGGLGPVRRHGATGSVDPKQQKKTMAIVLTIISAILLAGVGVIFFNNAKTKAARAKLTKMAAEEPPRGNVADVEMALKFLNSKKASSTEKSDAIKMLSKLQGEGIDEALLKALQDNEASSFTRWKLSRVLADRGYSPAVPAMMSTFARSSSDNMRLEILSSIRKIASPENTDALLEALSADQNLTDRVQLEAILLGIYRQLPKSTDIAGPLLERVKTAEPDERLSLYRILGSLGRKEVLEALKTVYDKPDSPDRLSPMAAYLSWPDRSALDQLGTLISEGLGSRDTIRIKAIEAYSQIASLPAAVPLEEKTAAWRQALGWTKSVGDYPKIFIGLVDNPAPETQALAKEFESHQSQRLSSLASQAAANIAKLIENTPVLGADGKLDPAKALIRGNTNGAVLVPVTDEEGKPFDPPRSVLTSWKSPETWFVWHFKVPVSADYGIEVVQSDSNSEPSEFQVIIGATALDGKSKPTKSIKDFEPVALDGAVTLEAEKVHTLFLRAGDVVQPRMMNIETVRLVAK